MRLFWLSLLVISLCTGCRGAEGHYTIDRDLSAVGLDKFADQQLEKMFTKRDGTKNQVPEDLRKSVKEEFSRSFREEFAMDLHLEPDGKVRGSMTIEEETETLEGQWALRGKVLEITETHENGQPLAKPRVQTFRYQDGRLSFDDPDSQFPFLILSRQ